MRRQYLLVYVAIPLSFNSEKPTHISRIVDQILTVFRLEGKRDSEIMLIEVELLVL